MDVLCGVGWGLVDLTSVGGLVAFSVSLVYFVAFLAVVLVIFA
jgi:hypothetical protein